MRRTKAQTTGLFLAGAGFQTASITLFVAIGETRVERVAHRQLLRDEQSVFEGDRT